VELTLRTSERVSTGTHHGRTAAGRERRRRRVRRGMGSGGG
jgi:hypothetical protein